MKGQQLFHKRQQLFHSFLPGVTAAVLTTQPAWAGTVKVSSIQQKSSSSVVTFSESHNLVADNTNTQLPKTANQIFPDAVSNSELTTFNVPNLSNHSNRGTLAENPGVALAQISQKNQGGVVDATPTLNFSQNLEQRNSRKVQKQKKSATAVREKLNNTSVNSATSQASASQKNTVFLSAIQQPAASRPNLKTQLPIVRQTAVKGAGAAQLLAARSCSQQIGISTTLSLYSKGCEQQKLTGELTAQNNTATPSAAEVTPDATTVPSNADFTPTEIAPTATPTVTEAAPNSPVPSNVNPAPSGAVPVPENLIPSANSLQFPTKAEEVTVQGNQPITLEQALELAKRNNRELQVSVLQLERSRAALREAQAALYPSVDLSADVTRSQSASSQLQDTLSGRAGVRSNNDEPSTGFNGQAQLTYNIYTSGRRQAAIKEAEEQTRFNELDVERQSEEIRLNVSTQYYDLQGADEQVRINQSAVENAQASLRDAEALERAGVGTRFDVLRSQVNLANAQQDLTNAISNQLIARRQLVTTLSLPQNISISAADTVQLAGLWDRSLEDSIVLAFQNRPELRQQLAQRNISEQQRRQALAANLPQLSFVANYNLLDQFDDSVSITDGYSVGLRASWNLFDGGAARARASQAKANIAIAETNFAEQRNQVRFQVEQAFSTQRANLDNVQTANTALEQAREALRLARLRFQAGVGTQTDVINSETDLTRAEGNRVTAILNYNRALAQLQRAVTIRSVR
ncbi:TolC family protein [Nostoc sp. PCC 7107]|uniref:TolC family protein n=1 Tax=Nostoc sp. PCC 7107 TaxID=317936 RepID=UPI00029F41B7|nr:TolC family protein [Nostoc sp. PCC 7107]AFY42703.1 outer membrane efflux protein [Nostoc sp. PCC 7107]